MTVFRFPMFFTVVNRDEKVLKRNPKFAHFLRERDLRATEGHGGPRRARPDKHTGPDRLRFEGDREREVRVAESNGKWIVRTMK